MKEQLEGNKIIMNARNFNEITLASKKVVSKTYQCKKCLHKTDFTHNRTCPKGGLCVWQELN